MNLIVQFQNGFNKVVIELRFVQFWFEIILVISNRNRNARSFDFEITRMISDQIALHLVQLFVRWCSLDLPATNGILILTENNRSAT